MITNERQYAITKGQVDRFEQTLSEGIQDSGKPLNPRALRAMRESIASQLQDLREEIAEYEKLRDGTTTTIVGNSILDLAVGLVKARIVRNWTQKELADRLGLPEQQVQRYEATLYKGVALERLQEVADALKVRLREVMTLERV